MGQTTLCGGKMKDESTQDVKYNQWLSSETVQALWFKGETGIQFPHL